MAVLNSQGAFEIPRQIRHCVGPPGKLALRSFHRLTLRMTAWDNK